MVPKGPLPASQVLKCRNSTPSTACWAIIRPSLRDFRLQTAVTARGLERNALRTERVWVPSCHDSAVPAKSGQMRNSIVRFSLRKPHNVDQVTDLDGKSGPGGEAGGKHKRRRAKGARAKFPRTE